MTTGKIIETIMNQKGIKQKALGAALGHNSPSAIYNILQRNKMNSDNFVKIMDVLGYEVVVQPKMQDKHNDDTILLTNGDDK